MVHLRLSLHVFDVVHYPHIWSPLKINAKKLLKAVRNDSKDQAVTLCSLLQALSLSSGMCL